MWASQQLILSVTVEVHTWGSREEQTILDLGHTWLSFQWVEGSLKVPSFHRAIWQDMKRQTLVSELSLTIRYAQNSFFFVVAVSAMQFCRYHATNTINTSFNCPFLLRTAYCAHEK